MPARSRRAQAKNRSLPVTARNDTDGLRHDTIKTLTTNHETEVIQAPGVYLWEPPGKTFAVRLSFDVVDRMLQDVMRGFGAVPKRGAEVGGVLLGRVGKGEKTIVTIDDFETVPIAYKRSPSFLLSDEDAKAFDGVVQRTRNGADPLLRPVGYFRSHTREGVGLGPEDAALMAQHFPEPDSVALIVRPFASRVSQAGFYFKENGQFPAGLPLLEFPFRRRELDPDSPPPSRAARPADRHPLGSSPGEQREHKPLGYEPPAGVQRGPTPGFDDAASGYASENKPKSRNGWVWVPLSFIFLLLGVLLGFQAALSMRPQLPAGSNEPYNLSVTVTQNGGNLQIKWDRQALAIRTAQKGLLTIEDGTYTKPVPLNASELQSGSVVYPPQSKQVRFRLDVSVSARDVVSESVEWHK
ncbi:MAG: hypothetical protein ABSH09_01385 [Bryobacteraceae bacterium]|jgi:hypothetical protein